MSRYYPGFLAAFFIVLLRIAIGWHFLHEGLRRSKSTFEREGAVLGRDLSAKCERPVRPLFPADDSGRRRPRAARSRIGSRPTGRPTSSRISSHYRIRRTISRSEAAGDPGRESSVARHTGSTTRRTPRSSRSMSTTCVRSSRPTSIRNALSFPERAGLGRAPEPGGRPPLVDRAVARRAGKRCARRSPRSRHPTS